MAKRMVAAVLLLAGLRLAGAQTAAAVPQLDLKMLTGTWYEVMRYPTKDERRCVQESTVLYALGDQANSFSVVKTCPQKDGFTNVKNQSGRKADASGGGRLKVRTLWPFWGRYSVVALGPDYAWAVLGSDNHKSLWVLARTQAPASDVLAEIRAKAAAAGFDVTRLVTPPAASPSQGEKTE
jgi:apolipoprotein D and lipocalin family protein